MITTIVGFAISMAFLFLMLSAACSAIQEIVANLLHWRSTTLERGLAGLLVSEEFQKAIYDLPLIQGLCSSGPWKKSPKRTPSYIPSSTLALAILQAAEDKKLNLNAPADSTPAHNFAETEKLLASLLRGCKDVAEQRKRLEDWFDSSMERVSGWYKRKAHAWIWVFGLILCLLLNADAITLSKRFWNDQTLREAIATEATEYVKSTPKDQATGGDDHAELNQSIHRLNLLRENLPGVPLGWCFVNARAAGASDRVQADGLKATCWPDLVHPTAAAAQVSLAGTDPRLVNLDDWSWWLWKIAGIVATVLAISQGAPFWFDLLQKAVNLRLAGTPPAEKDKK